MTGSSGIGAKRGRVVAIHQPNFLPWCGYFAKACASDVFVFLDDAQMSKGSYISRTQIAIGNQPRWLSVPVTHALNTPIDEVEIVAGRWTEKLLRTLSQNYAKAPYFTEIMEILAPVLENPPPRLAPYNQKLIETIFEYLEIKPAIFRSSQLGISTASDDRLIDIVKAVGGNTYLSGKGGANYQDPAKFEAAGIALDVRAYKPIPYAKAREDFIPGLSVIDALFYLGREARSLLVYPAS